MNRVGAAWLGMRPAHWLKNAPVLAGLVYGGRIADGAAVRSVAVAFASFCLVASAGYLVNDVVDRDVDRGHPLRRRRPIASGALSVRAALGLAVALALLGVGLAGFQPRGARLCLFGYAATTLSYTFALRRMAVVGPVAIALGFVLRAAAGAYAASVAPSAWLLSLTGVLSLALVVSKREADERRREAEAADGADATSTLRRTTDGLLWLSAVGYVAYGFSPDTIAIHGTRWLPVTAIPVVAAIVRYRSRLRASREGLGPAELVARDPVLLALGVVWAAASIVVLRVG